MDGIFRYSLPEWPLFEYKSFLSRYVGIVSTAVRIFPLFLALINNSK